MEKYVAYISAYTMGGKENHGIKIYDVDLENGLLIPKDSVEITNSSYATVSHNGKYLYSITDFGVEAFSIDEEGLLTLINRGSINGMRGCYLSTDFEDKFLFCGGYHDGKLTVLRLLEDGSVGEITEEIYHKGFGSIAERNFRPHINCVKMTKDNKYLLAADLGMDHVNVYKLDHTTGKLKMVDVIRSELESAPRHIKFSLDGKYVYIVHELKNYIAVYSYREEDDLPVFEKIQNITTLNENHAGGSAASALTFSEDYRYLCTSNAGDNSATVYEADEKTGLLRRIFTLPIAGEYPKDVSLFPDNRHLVSLNQESNNMTFFTVDLQKGHLIMSSRPQQIDQPNTIIFYRLPEGEKRFGKK